MPSPMFWNMCPASVNGAWPIHCAPSPPICVIELTCALRAVGERDHRVAADAAAGDRALGHDRRAVVRAAGAEVRRARRPAAAPASAAPRRGGRQLDPLAEHPAQRPGQRAGGQLAADRHQRRARRRRPSRAPRGRRASRTARPGPADSTNGVFSSTTSTVLEAARRTRAAAPRSSGWIMPSAQQPDPGAASSRRRRGRGRAAPAGRRSNALPPATMPSHAPGGSTSTALIGLAAQERARPSPSAARTAAPRPPASRGGTSIGTCR